MRCSRLGRGLEPLSAAAWYTTVVTLGGRVHWHRSLAWGWRRESSHTASKRLLRKRCGYAIPSLSIHTARGRPGRDHGGQEARRGSTSAEPAKDHPTCPGA